MNYAAAFGYPFRGPNVWANIGLILVCFLIPIIGPIVVLGYIIGAEKLLIRNIHADAPRFDFSQFSPYLTRGVYPFLASLVIILLLYVVIIPVVIIFVLLFVLAQKSSVMIGVLIALVFLTYFVMIMAFSAIAQPMIFRAGLMGSFGEGFNRAFVADYLKRVGWLSIVAHLVVLLMLIPLMVLGCIPFIGPGVAMALFMPMQAHINTQLYLLYLDRGGTPIPFQEDQVNPVAFPVVESPAPPTLPPTL